MVLAYHVTHGLPVSITRGSNTIGPYQYPEKVVPLFVTNALESKPLPIYGDGGALRDYLHVDDHCAGILLVLERGQPGEIYNVGGGNQVNTVQLADAILRELGLGPDLKSFVPDRPGHDRRYCLDTTKLRDLGWAPRYDFQAALAATVTWYVENDWWWKKIKSGEYQEWYRRNYLERSHASVR